MTVILFTPLRTYTYTGFVCIFLIFCTFHGFCCTFNFTEDHCFTCAHSPAWLIFAPLTDLYKSLNNNMALPLLCIETGCKYNRKEHKDSDTIRCTSCMDWFHIKCVNETHPENVHTCISCRKIPTYIKNIMLSMATLIEKVGTIDISITDLRNKQDTLMKQFNEVQKESEAAKADNSILRKEILTLRAELHKVNWPLQPSDSDVKPTLVLGSSVLRDIDNDKIQNTFVHSISGGKIKDAMTYIDDVPAGKYSNITLVIGGNDCEDTATTTADIVKIYTDLIGKAQQKSTHVTVASILPRHCPNAPDVSQRIDTVNAELQVSCTENNCKYVDNNTSFKLQDGNLNDGYYLHERNTTKLVHLNDRGTSKLCDLLNIKPKDTKVTKDRTRNRPQERTDHTSRQSSTHPPQWARSTPAPRPPRPQPSDFPERPVPDRLSTRPSRQTPLPSRRTQHRPARAVDYSPPRSVASDRDHPRYEKPYQQQTTHSPAHEYTTYNDWRYDQHSQVPTCFNCGERHRLDRCWYPDRLTCLHCNNPGHKEKNCPYLRSTQDHYSPRFTHELDYY